MHTLLMFINVLTNIWISVRNFLPKRTFNSNGPLIKIFLQNYNFVTKSITMHHAFLIFDLNVINWTNIQVKPKFEINVRLG
jgi:hypothetical protein